MKLRSGLFNMYLCGAGLAGFLAGGCTTPGTFESNEDKPNQQLTALHIHMEATADALGRTMEVPVYRARPVLLTVEKAPFLTEANVLTAEVVEEPEGFSIRIEFERQGRWLLESYTAANQSRRLGIWVNFGSERWLGAPQVRKVITDGKLTFTPDATQEEALRIVRGLKNVAKKMKHDPRF